ncbi:hypothetical protein ACFWA9_29175 [Kitasatospora sp. NPDC059973]|uniref:hypothetical protein n=1 Tax=Kitasatospora sp. NPDC059973 TaxID=3347020 RepID=UPI0036A851EF
MEFNGSPEGEQHLDLRPYASSDRKAPEPELSLTTVDSGSVALWARNLPEFEGVGPRQGGPQTGVLINRPDVVALVDFLTGYLDRTRHLA